jgi:ABC-type polar amino acid transport system ATPase subunit
MQLLAASISRLDLSRFSLRVDNLELHSGEALICLGPNGSGKTSLIRALLGLQQFQEGSVKWSNGDSVVTIGPKSDTPAQLPSIVSGVLQKAWVWPNLTVAENIKYPTGADKDRTNGDADRALELFGLRELAGRRAWRLSGGQQQRVALARAFGVAPAALAFDEPTSALDAKFAQAFVQKAKAYRDAGGGLIVATHSLYIAEAIGSRYLFIDDGRVADSGEIRGLRSSNSEPVRQWLTLQAA